MNTCKLSNHYNNIFIAAKNGLSLWIYGWLGKIKWNNIIRRLLSAPGLAWQLALKRTKLKLHLFTDIGILLISEKDVRGGICHSISQYEKVNNKYMKYYDKDKEASYI